MLHPHILEYPHIIVNMSTQELDLDKVQETGRKSGLEGDALKSYVQEVERNFRQEERERRRAERELEASKVALEEKRIAADTEMKRLELEAAKEKRDHEYRMKLLEAQVPATGVTDGAMGGGVPPGSESTSRRDYQAMKWPLQPFEPEKERIDQYLEKYEAMAIAMGLDKQKWCLKLSQGLRAESYEVYARLPPGLQNDYPALKAALLKRFEITAHSYRRKFRTAKREPGELFSSYSVRLNSYLLKWMAFAGFK